MPLWLQKATYADPLRYCLIVMRGVYLKGVGFEILWPQMSEMVVLGVLMLTLSVLRFRKALD
jgi:drug efflux transport system permease protein